jgi:hypothetical protein
MVLESEFVPFDVTGAIVNYAAQLSANARWATQKRGAAEKAGRWRGQFRCV